MLVAEAFVVGKHERAVGTKRGADRSAELVLVQWFDLSGEEIPRIEDVVAYEVVHAAVTLIAAGTGHHARRRATGTAIFGRSALRQNPEFCNGIDRYLEGIPAVHPIHVLGPVDQVDIQLRTHAVDGVGLALPQRPTGRRHTGGQRCDSGLKQAQLGEVPAVERQVYELAAADHTSEGSGRRVDELRASTDRHRFLQRRQLHPHGDSDRLTHCDVDGLLHDRRELRRARGDAVSTDRQQRQSEEPVTSAHHLAGVAGLEMLGRQLRARHRRRGLVGDDPLDRAGGILRTDLWRGHQAQAQHHEKHR